MRADMFAADTNTNNLSALGDLPYKKHNSSANWNNDKIGKSHGAGRLDSKRAWSAKKNKNTEWYELRSGSSPINITGVAMKGRPDHPQWITSVKIQYEDENGKFKSVDDGFAFRANYDQNSLVKIFFEKPVKTNSIRIYPQSWKSHASGRFGILRGDDSLKIPDESPPSTEKYQIMGYTFE